jgi:hypothetical protein
MAVLVEAVEVIQQTLVLEQVILHLQHLHREAMVEMVEEQVRQQLLVAVVVAAQVLQEEMLHHLHKVAMVETAQLQASQGVL